MTFNFKNIVGLATLTGISFFVNSCSTPQTAVSRDLGSQIQIIAEPKSKVSNELARSPQSLIQRKYFDWPIDEARLTRGYSADPIPHPKKRRKKKSHWGIDLAAFKGTPIYSSHQGVVVYSGKDFKGYGKMVLLEGENGWATVYAHLDKITVKEGQKLRQGDLVGTMGRTGRVTGVHLHFEIRQNKEAYDPLLFLPNGEKVASQLARK